MSKHVAIIGGGVVGLFSAYYLLKSGHKVTVIDKGDFSDGCSFGNAGMIVPSHIVPLAAPGMIAQGVKWMFDSKSPFYVKPRVSSELFAWGRKFYKSANQSKVDAAMPVLRDLSLFSKKLYQELTTESNDFCYEEKGLLMLFQSEKVGKEEVHIGELAQKMGIEVDFLDQRGVQNLESGAEVNALGGVHFKSDAHLYPNRLMAFLRSELEAMNATLLFNTELKGMDSANGKVKSLRTTDVQIPIDEVVFAAGAWTPELARMLDEKLSLLPGKGYSFTFSTPEKRPLIPSILCEGKVAVSPMGNDIRFGGTMEITSVKSDAINRNRVVGIVNTINAFYPNLKVEVPPSEMIWKGFRPCSPDGLPYIGRSSRFANVAYATGHGMMGLSLAPATGKLIAQLINETETEVALTPFRLDRF